jgi:hypothetical protein
MTSHPGSMVPDDQSEVKPAVRRERRAPTRWTDLVALVAILSVPLVLVLVGHAQVAIIVASGEFAALLLRTWLRGRS